MKQLLLNIYDATKRMIYKPFDPQGFSNVLDEMDIKKGDTVFVMYTAKRIHKRAGRKIDVNQVLDTILDKIGEDGTLMALCFATNRKGILDKSVKFDVKNTPTMSGILSEFLRQKPGACRSINPIFSAVAFGKHAKYICEGHDLNPYPFSNSSPYFKLVELDAKYLGLGLGFDAFTPMHILDDNYEDKYIHKMYNDEPEAFEVIDENGNPKTVLAKTRRVFERQAFWDIIYYRNILKVKYKQKLTRYGFHVFSMDVKDFYEKAVEAYESKRITLWTTGGSGLRRFINYKWIFLRDYL